MLNNYYTLFHLSNEFKVSLSGARVLQASTRLKHTLGILFEKENGNTAKLVVSCIPHDNFVYDEDSAGRKLKGANVLPEIVGKVVAVIGIVSNERQLYLEFTDHTFLRMNLFGSAANAYCTDADGIIINSFLKPVGNVGKRLSTSPNPVDFPMDVDDLRSRFSGTTGDMVHRLPKCIPTADSILAREISYRYYLLHGKHPDEDCDIRIDFESLALVLAAVKGELAMPSPRLYLSARDGQPVAFGLIELKHLQMKDFKKYDSVNCCVRDFVIDSDRRKRTLDIKTDVMRKLSRKIDSLQRTLAKIDSDLKSNRSEKNRFFGEYLMSHLADIKQGGTSIAIAESETEIKLDPALKPVQNAQAYFEKAKHARLSTRQAEKRKKDITRELREAQSLMSQVDGQEDGNLRTREVFLESVKESVADDERPRSPFRQFEHNGHKIYVGKDAKNNDELTFGFAKPNDVFLHARGVSGSHVIIRNSSREYPQKPIILFAASVAAHYSKARSSGIVPVAYTMRKFVKKAKGKPGAVMLDREEVVFVKPGIPDAVRSQQKKD
jgi:predicted ribosome quality control (RQC) complex YloA/Tae2 family protein